MPAKLVKGQDAHDVAAYVGRVAATPGKDTGALATVGQAQQKPLAKAENGTLDDPRRPDRPAALSVQERDRPGRRADHRLAEQVADAARHLGRG